MTSEYAVGLLGLAASVCAVIALVWAAKRRQLRTDDQAMYEAVSDDEPDFAAGPPSSPPTRLKRGLFISVFAVLFGLVSWMIVQTVRVSARVPSQPTVSPGLRPGK